MNDADASWISKWLDGVAAGSVTMSQRSRPSIDAHGGIGAVLAAARARRVHLVQLTDERGQLLVAASREPFEVLC